MQCSHSLHTVVLSKTRVNLSVFMVHGHGDIIDTSLQSYTLFIKKTLADTIILWLLNLGITMLIHNKDDIVFVTEFP